MDKAWNVGFYLTSHQGIGKTIKITSFYGKLKTKNWND